MPDVIDLSTLKDKQPEQPGPDYDSLSEEQREALGKLADEHGTGAPEEDKDVFESAFLVLISPEGQVVSTPDIDLVNNIVTRRQPTRDEVYGAANVLVRDITAAATAEASAAMISHLAEQKQRQMQEAALAQRLQNVDLTKSPTK